MSYEYSLVYDMVMRDEEFVDYYTYHNCAFFGNGTVLLVRWEELKIFLTKSNPPEELKEDLPSIDLYGVYIELFDFSFALFGDRLINRVLLSKEEPVANSLDEMLELLRHFRDDGAAIVLCYPYSRTLDLNTLYIIKDLIDGVDVSRDDMFIKNLETVHKFSKDNFLRCIASSTDVGGIEFTRNCFITEERFEASEDISRWLRGEDTATFFD